MPSHLSPSLFIRIFERDANRQSVAMQPAKRTMQMLYRKPDDLEKSTLQPRSNPHFVLPAPPLIR